jgi:hypothetical protein
VVALRRFRERGELARRRAIVVEFACERGQHENVGQ